MRGKTRGGRRVFCHFPRAKGALPAVHDDAKEKNEGEGEFKFAIARRAEHAREVRERGERKELADGFCACQQREIHRQTRRVKAKSSERVQRKVVGVTKVS